MKRGSVFRIPHIQEVYPMPYSSGSILKLLLFTSFCTSSIASGQGQTPWGQNFDVNRKALSLCPFAASLKKISLKSDFIHFFSCFYTCI